MMQIVEDAGGEVPNGTPLQGVIAFTPGLIKESFRDYWSRCGATV